MFFGVLVLIVSACASGSSTTEQGLATQTLVVEGMITVRGNEPFTAVILQTANRNHYLLKMSSEMRNKFLTPAFRRVTGRLYLGQWNGRDYAHLEVYQMEEIPRKISEARSSIEARSSFE